MPTSSEVDSVYDGDTFTLTNGDRVRVMWVNTPELRPLEDFGLEAKDYTYRFVFGRRVELSYGDVTRDGYGRLLGGVTVDGRHLAEGLLEEGFGHLFLIPPIGDHTPTEALIAAQYRAHAANKGIWSTERYSGELHITSFHANAPGNDMENVNGESVRICNITNAPLNTHGYWVSDADGHSFPLPSVEVPPGHTLKLYSGVGEDQFDPSAQMKIYLGSERPIWNNDYDRVTIYDPYGRVVDSALHKIKAYTGKRK